MTAENDKTSRLPQNSLADAAEQRYRELFANKKPLIIKEVNDRLEEEDFFGERGNIGEVVTSCRPDAVMIIVYKDQPITVPFEALSGPFDADKVLPVVFEELLRNHGLEPDPPTKAGIPVVNLGHAGVCIIDGKQEKAYYYEYGRYDTANKGIVRISDNFGDYFPLIFEGDNPTKDSLKELSEALRKTNNPKGYDFQSVYIKVACGKALVMRKRAETQITKGRWLNGEQRDYSLEDNHCMTFAIDIAQSGGVNVAKARAVKGFSLTEADKEFINKTIDDKAGMLNRIALKWQLVETLENELKSKPTPHEMMNALQTQYTKLDYRAGDFDGFSYPKHLYR